MNELVVSVFESATYISAILILIIGALLTVSLLMYPIWFLLNNILYKRTKGSIYFVAYIRNRKTFIEWYKKKKSDVHSGKIRNKDF